MAQVKDRLGHLFETGAITMTATTNKEGQTPWVWLQCTQRLSANTPENQALKEIGFRWSKKRCQWYHTCEDNRAWYPRYGWKRKSRTTTTSKEPEPIAEQTAHEVSAASADAFAKLFGVRP